MFAVSSALLGIADGEKAAGRAPGLDELIALLLWAWAAPQLGDAGPDPFPALKKAFLGAGMVVALPKGMRAQVIDLLALTGRLTARPGRRQHALVGAPCARAMRLLRGYAS